jgi:hypothetical protein
MAFGSAAALATALTSLAAGTATASAATRPSAAVRVLPAGTIDGGDSLISSNSGGANVRVSATMASQSIDWLPNGVEIVMLCWTTGQTVSPPNSNYTSNRWFKIEPIYSTEVGFVHSSLVIDQATVRQC